MAALASNTTGCSQHRLGQNAGANLTTGSNNIDIGNVGCGGRMPTRSASASMERRRPPLSPVSVGVTVASGVGVIVDSNGQLGTVTLLGAVQGSDQADGQSERSDPCASSQ